MLALSRLFRVLVDFGNFLVMALRFDERIDVAPLNQPTTSAYAQVAIGVPMAALRHV